MRLIDADEFAKILYKNIRNDNLRIYAEVCNHLKDMPTIDVIPKSAYEQTAWERDLAIMQLNDIGKGLGEKMDDIKKVVRCADCKYNNACMTQSFVEDEGVIPIDRDTFYCADAERKANG